MARKPITTEPLEEERIGDLDAAGFDAEVTFDDDDLRDAAGEFRMSAPGPFRFLLDAKEE